MFGIHYWLQERESSMEIFQTEIKDTWWQMKVRYTTPRNLMMAGVNGVKVVKGDRLEALPPQEKSRWY